MKELLSHTHVSNHIIIIYEQWVSEKYSFLVPIYFITFIYTYYFDKCKKWQEKHVSFQFISFEILVNNKYYQLAIIIIIFMLFLIKFN